MVNTALNFYLHTHTHIHTHNTHTHALLRSRPRLCTEKKSQQQLVFKKKIPYISHPSLAEPMETNSWSYGIATQGGLLASQLVARSLLAATRGEHGVGLLIKETHGNLESELSSTQLTHPPPPLPGALIFALSSPPNFTGGLISSMKYSPCPLKCSLDCLIELTQGGGVGNLRCPIT